MNINCHNSSSLPISKKYPAVPAAIPKLCVQLLWSQSHKYSFQDLTNSYVNRARSLNLQPILFETLPLAYEKATLCDRILYIAFRERISLRKSEHSKY